MHYYCDERGPWTELEIFDRLLAGDLSAQSMVRRENSQNAVPLHSCELGTLLFEVNLAQNQLKQKIHFNFVGWAISTMILAVFLTVPVIESGLWSYYSFQALSPGEIFLLAVTLAYAVGALYFQPMMLGRIWQLVPRRNSRLSPFWNMIIWYIPIWGALWNFKVMIKPIKALSPHTSRITAWGYCLWHLAFIGWIVLKAFGFLDNFTANAYLLVLLLLGIGVLLSWWLVMFLLYELAMDALCNRNLQLIGALASVPRHGLFSVFDCQKRLQKRLRHQLTYCILFGVVLPLAILSLFWLHASRQYQRALENARSAGYAVTSEEMYNRYPAFNQADVNYVCNRLQQLPGAIPRYRIYNAAVYPAEIAQEWNNFFNEFQQYWLDPKQLLTTEGYPAERAWEHGRFMASKDLPGFQTLVYFYFSWAAIAFNNQMPELASNVWQTAMWLSSWCYAEPVATRFQAGIELDSAGVGLLELQANQGLAAFPDEMLRNWSKTIAANENAQRREIGKVMETELLNLILLPDMPFQDLYRMFRYDIVQYVLFFGTPLGKLKQAEEINMMIKLVEASGLEYYQAKPLLDEIMLKYRSHSNSQLYTRLIKVIKQAAKATALERCAQTALAVELFRRQNGNLPSGLNKLVPNYLEAVPLDPFNGRPLRYKTGVLEIEIPVIARREAPPVIDKPFEEMTEYERLVVKSTATSQGYAEAAYNYTTELNKIKGFEISSVGDDDDFSNRNFGEITFSVNVPTEN